MLHRFGWLNCISTLERQVMWQTQGSQWITSIITGLTKTSSLAPSRRWHTKDMYTQAIVDLFMGSLADIWAMLTTAKLTVSRDFTLNEHQGYFCSLPFHILPSRCFAAMLSQLNWWVILLGQTKKLRVVFADSIILLLYCLILTPVVFALCNAPFLKNLHRIIKTSME